MIFHKEKIRFFSSPVVKKIFKTPVKIKINSTGFMPRRIDFRGIREIAILIPKNSRQRP